MNTRRDFLKTGTVALVAAAAMPVQGSREIDIVRYHRFANLLNTEFRVTLQDGTVIKLILSEIQARTVSSDFEQFSLRFTGVGNNELRQGTYMFKHRKISGSFPIFIVPNPGGNHPEAYEAVFNRFV